MVAKILRVNDQAKKVGTGLIYDELNFPGLSVLDVLTLLETETKKVLTSTGFKLDVSYACEMTYDKRIAIVANIKC